MPFVELAPSNRILGRVQLAWAFTSFQYFALLESLPEVLTDCTELVVVPDMDGYYRSDDRPAEGVGTCCCQASPTCY